MATPSQNRKSDAGDGTWFTTDPELKFEAPELKGILAYWQGKRGERDMPGRGDIDIDELRARSGNVILIDVEHEPLRLSYRFLGSNITAAVERDATGRYYDELYPPERAERLHEAFRWIIEHRAPLRTRGRVSYPEKSFYVFEAALLPLAEDGGPIDMVLGGLIFQLPTD